MNAPRRKVRRAPAWVVTFADLVTVVLAFFVLMLSFSATDTRQYDRGSDSMAAAFADDLGGVFDRVSPVRLGVPAARVLATEPEKMLARVTGSLLRKIESGLVRVETTEHAVVLRFDDLAFFSQGSERVTPSFRHVIDRVAALLGETEGAIAVQGHTDDVPISPQRFRSNWELSTARAVSVVHELLKNPAIDPTRVVVEGHADATPLVPNDNPEHRAQNRRVEIHISTCAIAQVCHQRRLRAGYR